MVNPPEAGIVDDLVAAALLLRCAAGRGPSDDIGVLCASVAERLEADAAALRGPSYFAALDLD